MPAKIHRYNEGRAAAPEPDLTTEWQGYVLTARQLPVSGVEGTHPGLYKDSYGDTWLKSGDGGVTRLPGASSFASSDALPVGSDVDLMFPEEVSFGVYPLNGSYTRLPPGCPNPVQGVMEILPFAQRLSRADKNNCTIFYRQREAKDGGAGMSSGPEWPDRRQRWRRP